MSDLVPTDPAPHYRSRSARTEKAHLMPEPWYAPLRAALMIAEVIAGHIVAGTIVLGGGFLLHHMLVEEGDPKAFDTLPWRYVVDAGDLLIMMVLAVVSITAILQMEGRRKNP